MNPNMLFPHCGHMPLPRTRGDEPRDALLVMPQLSLYPAHAGMNPPYAHAV